MGNLQEDTITKILSTDETGNHQEATEHGPTEMQQPDKPKGPSEKPKLFSSVQATKLERHSHGQDFTSGPDINQAHSPSV